MTKLLSVVIVNYNAGSLLEKCVVSVAQSDCDVEIIVIDNCSSDDSLQFVTEWSDVHVKLKVERNPTNRGFAAACNQGRSLACGEHLLFLNPDCEVEKSTLSTLSKYLGNNDDIGLIGGLMLNFDGTEQRGCRRAIPRPWTSLVNSFGLHRLQRWDEKKFSDFRMDGTPLPQEPIEVEAISGACMMTTSLAWADVGPLDEGYFMHCEDLDWCYRFTQKGWKIIFHPDAILYHAQGSCSSSRPIFVEWVKHKGMVRFYRKFFSAGSTFPIKSLVLLGIWIRFLTVLIKLMTRSR